MDTPNDAHASLKVGEILPGPPPMTANGAFDRYAFVIASVQYISLTFSSCREVMRERVSLDPNVSSWPSSDQPRVSGHSNSSILDHEGLSANVLKKNVAQSVQSLSTTEAPATLLQSTLPSSSPAIPSPIPIEVPPPPRSHSPLNHFREHLPDSSAHQSSPDHSTPSCPAIPSLSNVNTYAPTDADEAKITSLDGFSPMENAPRSRTTTPIPTSFSSPQVNAKEDESANAFIGSSEPSSATPIPHSVGNTSATLPLNSESNNEAEYRDIRGTDIPPSSSTPSTEVNVGLSQPMVDVISTASMSPADAGKPGTPSSAIVHGDTFPSTIPQPQVPAISPKDFAKSQPSSPPDQSNISCSPSNSWDSASGETNQSVPEPNLRGEQTSPKKGAASM